MISSLPHLAYADPSTPLSQGRAYIKGAHKWAMRVRRSGCSIQSLSLTPVLLSDSHLVTTSTSIPTPAGLIYFLPHSHGRAGIAKVCRNSNPGRALSASEVVRGPFSRPMSPVRKNLGGQRPDKESSFSTCSLGRGTQRSEATYRI
jgi:hypothetical protein